MAAPDGADGPHAFVADVASPELSDEDHHHLARALRLRRGDSFTVSDGRGAWRRCRFGDVVLPDGEIVTVPPPTIALTVGFALTKGSKPELVCQKLTELGIDHIVPFVAERSVARWDDTKAAKNQARLERVIREAAMQSRRVHLPTLHPLGTFGGFVGTEAVRADGRGRPLTAAHTTVLIGPEGGWADEERVELDEVSLGAHVLRAETAAIAAGALMAHARAQT